MGALPAAQSGDEQNPDLLGGSAGYAGRHGDFPCLHGVEDGAVPEIGLAGVHSGISDRGDWDPGVRAPSQQVLHAVRLGVRA